MKKLYIAAVAAALIGAGLGVKTYGAQLPPMATSAYIGPDGQNHYQQRLAEIQAESPLTSGLLFVGDSLTEGCDWSALLPRTPLRNHGIGWDTSQGVLIGLPIILQNSPDHIFIMVGTNDLGYGRPQSEVLSNLKTLLDAIRAKQPRTQITVQAILPREATLWPVIHSFNISLKTAIADRRDSRLSYLDHTQTFISVGGGLNPALTYDGVHLNLKGCRLWADRLR